MSVRRVLVLVASTVAISACHRGVTVSSPSPAAAPAPTPAPATTSQAGTGAASTPAAGALPAGVTAAMVTEGETLFNGAPCARCHGQGGAGGRNGPSLVDATWAQGDGSYNFIVKVIHDGVPAPNIKGGFPFAMRPLGGATLTDDQVKSIAAFLFAKSHK